MNINEIFPQVERMLDWTAKRQQTISANLANQDTPGYHAQDVSFSETLNNIGLAATDGKHFQSSSKPGMRVYEVGGELKRNDNSVDIDSEMTELSKNGLHYVALVQFLNQRLRTIRSVINDGGRV